MNRRQFFAGAAAPALQLNRAQRDAGASGLTRFQRGRPGVLRTLHLAAAGGVRLGYDAYSIRGLRWKAPRLIQYAVELQLDTLQIGSLDDYESLEAPYLTARKEQAARGGIVIDQGMSCICPTSTAWNPANGTPEEYLVKGARVARAVGSKALRVFVSSPENRRSGPPIERHMESTVAVLKNTRAQVTDLGVKVAIENHGDFTARELREVVEAAGKDWTGVCYDSANPMSVLEDPMLTLEVLAPYILTSHFRDSVLFEHPRGAAFQWVALGDGCVEHEKVAARFTELCPGVQVQLEVITGRVPTVLPYLEPDFWKPFAKLPAADFARFVRLVKQGRPYTGPMMIPPAIKAPESVAAAMVEQQRIDLERSLEYAKKKLGLGINWRKYAAP
jgi:sugar phosphate isomerase/epimerase